VIIFLTNLFNAVFRRQYFPSAQKHACVVPILKPGKEPTLPTFYRLLSLLDTVGNVLKKTLLTRVFQEFSSRTAA
jgi:hypothetical protein